MSAALVLTGAPGAGKSSVLEALTTLLEIDGTAYGAIESEQLAWGSPWLEAGGVDTAARGGPRTAASSWPTAVPRRRDDRDRR